MLQVTLPDTVYAQRDTQTRLASETADNFVWGRYASGSVPELADALGRIAFSHEMRTEPLHAVLESAATVFAQHAPSRPLVVVGRSRRLAAETHAAELRGVLAEKNATLSTDFVKTMGELGAAFVALNLQAGLLVLQAGP